MGMDKISKELLVMLRNNSRFSFVELNKQSGIAQSTLFERLKKMGCLVPRTYSLLYWENIGFPIHLVAVIKTNSMQRQQVRKFLESNRAVNNAYRVTNNADFFIDAYFSSLRETEQFLDELNKQGVSKIKQFLISESLREQYFLTDKNHFS